MANLDSVFAPLSESCAKTLCDRTYEKRRLAAVEIEKTVYEYNNKKNMMQIKKLIEVLSYHFAASKDPNRRKGGLIGLAATSIGLGKDSEKYVHELVSPIISCLVDSDIKVRYYACESLYNVVKVVRAAIIPLFPGMFPALSRLVTDPDQQVKEGSELLDRLLKDIVTESSQSFDLSSFINLVRERIYVKNSFARQYVISWLTVLNAVPDISMVNYLPEILDGLFQMLEDKMEEIQRSCETLMSQFLKSIKSDSSSVQMIDMINILNGHAQSPNDLIKSTAIYWINEFVNLSGAEILPHASGVLTAILPCLAYEDDVRKNVREAAMAVNKRLLNLVTGEKMTDTKDRMLDLSSIMEVLKQYLFHSSVQTKVAALKWIDILFREAQSEILEHADCLNSVLLNTVLLDASDDVVLQGLAVLAEIVNCTQHKECDNVSRDRYRELLSNFLNLFNDRNFLESRGGLIIRRSCVLLSAERIYLTFSDIIAEDPKNYKMAPMMIRSLNMILLTSPELFEFRSTLRDINNRSSALVFRSLYKSWAHCPVSTLSLCLLARCYEHVAELVKLFGDFEVTVEFLTELDKLVQLIESPIFASLRLTLVSSCTDSKHLAHALYGILMLLPQTDSFLALKNRLQCVPTTSANISFRHTCETEEKVRYIDFNELYQHFISIQQIHRQQKIVLGRKNLLESCSK